MAKKIYIWGAGHFGVLTALDCERKGIKIFGFIDSNEELWGKKRLGIKVLSPNEFYKIKNSNGANIWLIVATLAEKTISKLLEEKGCFKGRDFEISHLIDVCNQNLMLRNAINMLQNSTKNEISILCDLYGSDKGSTFGGTFYYKWVAHTYTTIYEYLFNPIRNNVKNIFECGLGTNNQNMISNMGINGQPGASLRVWRDYFPNANIFGADIDREILFTENRIQTDFIDQTSPRDIQAFFGRFDKNSFDIMIDDGLHTFEAATTLLQNSIEYLSNNGLYIIEDLNLQAVQKFKEYIKDYTFLNVRYWLMSTQENPQNNLIVINRKNER